MSNDDINRFTPETLLLLPWQLPWQMLQAASKTVQLAPDALQQSINSGWSFGNVSVNSNNSSAPATELAIVAKASYGKQLGHLMDAVDVLLRRLLPEASKEAGTDGDAVRDFGRTRDEVEATKAEVARRRAERMVDDLRRLQEADEPAYTALRKRLLDFLDRSEK